jgi:uncharacterized FlgJ-related protein
MSKYRKEWINKWNRFVNEITAGTGIFPETVFTVAIAESSRPDKDGNWRPANNTLSLKANNIFSIKKGVGWNGEIFLHTDDAPDEPFRKYSSQNESFKDFVKFLQKNSRYTKAGVFDASTPEAQLAALAKAGYATSPTYLNLLNNVLKGIRGYIASGIETVKNNPGKIIAGVVIAYLAYNYLKPK